MKARILLFLVFIALNSPAVAQAYRIELRDGRIWLNGRLISPQELPPGFTVNPHLQARLVVEGEEEPIIDLAGYRFRIRDHRLELLPKETIWLSPGLMALLQQSGEQLRRLEKQLRRVQDRPEMREMEQYMRELERQLSQIQEQFARSAEEVMDKAGVWGARLYGERLAEQHLEIKSRQLAARIRKVQDEAERVRLRRKLRNLLEDLFELKQENRRREIRLVRDRLRELEEQLQAREKHRKAIIEQRMRELLGEDILYRW